jgi:dihydroneopterin aldolase
MSNKYKNISVISTGSWVPSNLSYPKNSKGTYEVQIKELTLMASIGIHEHEKIKKQRVSISLSIKVNDNISSVNEDIDNFVSYEKVIKNLKKIIFKGHIELLETLGEKIALMCFEDERILSIWMKLEKLDVFPDTKSVGIEIVRDKSDYSRKKINKSNIEKIKKK